MRVELENIGGESSLIVRELLSREDGFILAFWGKYDHVRWQRDDRAESGTKSSLKTTIWIKMILNEAQGKEFWTPGMQF